jgi:hypothetical protein
MQKPETALCISIKEYLELYAKQHNFVFWHNSNETTIKNFGWITNQKKMGKRAGVPDYTLMHKNFTLLIEVKPSKKNRLTPTQESFISEMEQKDMSDNIKVIYNWEEFLYIFKYFLNKIKET